MREFSTPLCKEGTASHREQWPFMMIGMFLCGAAAVYFLISSLSSGIAFFFSLLLISVCAILSLMSGLEMQQLLAKVLITATGITVIRPLAKEQSLTWDDFQQVCICLYRSGRGQDGYPQLCFVCKGEQRSMYDRWKTHSPFHHRKLIAIDYDDKVLETIRALCPLEVVDLRNTPPYQ